MGRIGRSQETHRDVFDCYRMQQLQLFYLAALALCRRTHKLHGYLTALQSTLSLKGEIRHLLDPGTKTGIRKCSVVAGSLPATFAHREMITSAQNANCKFENNASDAGRGSDPPSFLHGSFVNQGVRPWFQHDTQGGGLKSLSLNPFTHL